MTAPAGRMAGQRALVTSAHRYMGPAIVELFTAEGADVVADERSLLPLDAAAACVADAGDIDVRDRLFVGERVRVPTRDVRQIFSVEHSWLDGANSNNGNAGQRITARRLIARQADGRDVTLVVGLTIDDANALERALEAFLAIRDVPMVGARR